MRAARIGPAAMLAAFLVLVAAGVSFGAGPPDPLPADAPAGIGEDLPQVLYVVPWKDPEPGDPSAGPRVRLDEDILRTLDRDGFRQRLGLVDQAPGAP